MIELSPVEIQIALLIGGLRRTESLRQRLQDAHGFEGTAVWDVDIEGVAAEIAYSKFRGVYWGGCVNTFKAADVGDNIQVRSTKRRDGSLVIRDNDRDDHYYVLVVGQIPCFEVVGWIRGRDAKKETWKRAPNGRAAAYFVPQNALHRFANAKIGV